MVKSSSQALKNETQSCGGSCHTSLEGIRLGGFNREKTFKLTKKHPKMQIKHVFGKI